MAAAPGWIEALHDPGCYAPRPDRVEYLQTHISHLFFAGDQVFKVKKPVRFGFLDFSTLDLRRHFCAEEVRLNQALAPGVYRDVVPIRRDAQGAFHVGTGEGEVVEHAVRMHRLPSYGMLDARIARGDLDNERLRQTADLLCRFHAEADTGPGVDEHGAPAAVRRNCDENFVETEAFVGPDRVLSARLHGFLRERAGAFLDRHQDLLARRVSEGRIRDGHGDLHAGNICVLPDERIVIYDRIEFAARFRCGDVAADLAFLLMDLDHRRFRGFSSFLLREYVARSGDRELPGLVDFYKGYRAFVRGKVACLSWGDAGDPEARDAARGYFHLAASYGLDPALVLVCGLPGSGKSVVAEALARPFEAVVLNSDETRKRGEGGRPGQHRPVAPGTGIYVESASERTYATLREQAQRHLGRGRTVVVDAGFRRRARRAPFAELAHALGRRLVVVHVDTAPEVALARLRARDDRNAGASDAGEEVYQALRSGFEPPDELGDRVVRYDGVGELSAVTGAALDLLL